MRIFLDTADVDAIRTYAAWGVVDGVTTNPSLIKKSGRVFEQVVEEICGIVDGPVSAKSRGYTHHQHQIAQIQASINH